MTFKTRFCPRTFPDIPFTGGKHWCVDCWLILTKRRLARQWAMLRGKEWP